jgi:hypothetical protein
MKLEAWRGLFAVSGVALCLGTAACRRDAAAPLSAESVVGLMLGADKMGQEQRWRLIRALGTQRVRPWFVNLEDGSAREPDAAFFLDRGAEVMLVVRANGRGGTQPSPTQPPADLAAYGKALDGVLSRLRPGLLVVEHSETSPLFWAGTAEQYGAELRAAATLARAQGIKCANGGIDARTLLLVAWQGRLDRKGRRDADDFARRAFPPALAALVADPARQAEWQADVVRGRAFIAEYASAGIDGVNFLWDSPDPRALKECAAFLREATGLTPVCSQMSQGDTNPQTVGRLLAAALEAGLPWVTWYSMDRPGTRSLVNPDGTLRPNGEAFAAFMRARSGALGR